MSEEVEIDAIEVDAEDIAKSCEAKLTPYVCADCGRTFHKHRLSRRVRCPECAKARKKAYQRVYSQNDRKSGLTKRGNPSARAVSLRSLREMHKRCIAATKQVSIKELHSAKKKPQGVSDILWRIELRRRAAAGYYDLCPDVPTVSPGF